MGNDIYENTISFLQKKFICNYSLRMEEVAENTILIFRK